MSAEHHSHGRNASADRFSAEELFNDVDDLGGNA
jgi:hypothetical protein